MGADAPREVVLVGGGHAHVQVLREFAERPLPDSRLTVVVDTPVAVYSGMVPGYVAGQYRPRELEIDVRPLARLAGAGFIVARAVSVDAEQRRIVLEDQEPLPYYLASFNIGSTVLGLDLPGVRDYSLPTRPIGVFVQRGNRSGGSWWAPGRGAWCWRLRSTSASDARRGPRSGCR